MFSTDMNIFVFIALGFAGMTAGYTVFRYLPRLIDQFFDKVPVFNRLNKTLAYFISESIGIGLVVMLGIYGMGQLPESAALIAVLLTVASGAFIFTSEGWVTDAFAGMSLQLFPQYQIDDWVTLNGKRGQVARVGLFRTDLSTMGLDIISVKNSKVLSSDIINHSGVKLRRLILLVRVADYGSYDLDVKAFKADALSIIAEIQDQLCPEAMKIEGKSPKMWFVEFGEASDHFNVVFFNKETGARKALDGINVALATAFRPKGVVFGDMSLERGFEEIGHVEIRKK